MRVRFLEDFIGSLIGHQPKRQLRKSFPGENRFRADALKAAAETVHFRGRSSPGSLEAGVTRFSENCGRASHGENLGITKRQFGPRLALPRGERTDMLVKAGDHHAPLRVVE